MSKLPINAAAFSPSIGGIACYVLIKKSADNIIIKAHEGPKYSEHIGRFKKPDIDMFVVMRDVAMEEFGQIINSDNCTMIGDTWHEEEAAKAIGIPFI